MSNLSLKVLNETENLFKQKKWSDIEKKLNYLEKLASLNKIDNWKILILKTKYYTRIHKTSVAKNLVNTILSDYFDSKNHFLALDTYLIIAELEFAQGNLKRSLDNLNKVNDLLSKLNSISKKEKFFRLIDIKRIKGNIQYQKGEFEEASNNFNDILSISLDLKDNYLIFSSYEQLGKLYKAWGDYNLSLKNYKECLIIARKLKDKMLLSQSFTVLGRIYGKLGNLDKAIDYNLKSVELARDLKGYILMASLNNLGISYWENGLLNDALKYFAESLQIIKTFENQRSLAICYNNIGLVYTEKGELNKALTYLQLAYDIKVEMNDIEGQRSALANIAQVYSELKEYEFAQNYYQKSMNLYETIKNNFELAIVLFELADLYLKKQNISEAKVAIEKLRILSKKTGESVVRNRYKLALSCLWRKSENITKKQSARRICEEIINSEVTQHEIYFLAYLYLCEMLFESYTINSDHNTLNDLNTLLQNIIERTEKENLFFMTNSIYLLFGRIKLFQFKFSEAEKLFLKVNHQAKKRGYESLIRHSESDLQKIEEYFLIEKIMIKEKADSEKKRFKDVQIERIKDFIYELEIKK